MTITVAQLVECAAGLFSTNRREILSPTRLRCVFRARAAVALAARAVSGRSYMQIGIALGDRDPRTIMNACERAEEFYKMDEDFRWRFDQLVQIARHLQEASNDNASNDNTE